MNIKDNFSKQADLYAKYRPAYPKELYEFILKSVKKRNLALDCATGNGQVANELANYFTKVCATDISQKQLDYAFQQQNIEYSISKAEETLFRDDSFDLITVGQALHWFDFEKFYPEVKRVAKPEAILAVWGYGLNFVSTEIDNIVRGFYNETIGSYWDKERQLIDEQYETIPFPVSEIQTQSFSITCQWDLKMYEGYFTTWSSVQKYIAQNHINPVTNLIEHIRPYWKEGEFKTITFPIFLKLGIVK